MSRLDQLAVALTTGTITKEEAAEYDRLKPSTWSSASDAFRDAVFPPKQTPPGKDQPNAADKPADDPTKQPPAPNPVITLPDDFKFNGTYNAQQLAVTVSERRDKVSADIQALLASVDRFADEALADERERCKGRVNADADAKEFAERATAEHRRELYAKHEGRLLSDIAKLQTAEQQAAAYAKIFGCNGEKPSALNLASLHRLGSPERSAFASQMQDFGPQELAAAARYAIATKDKNLAAAVKSLNDALPSKLRVISSSDLADALFGDEAHAIWNAARQSRLAVGNAMAKLRELKTGSRNGRGLIESGLMQRETRKPPEQRDPNDVSISNDSAISKIAKGLSQLGNA